MVLRCRAALWRRHVRDSASATCLVYDSDLTPRFLSPKASVAREGRTEMKRIVVLLVAALALGASWAQTPAESPNGVKTLDPPGAIKAVGTWSLGARAGDFVLSPACRV